MTEEFCPELEEVMGDVEAYYTPSPYQGCTLEISITDLDLFLGEESIRRTFDTDVSVSCSYRTRSNDLTGSNPGSWTAWSVEHAGGKTTHGSGGPAGEIVEDPVRSLSPGQWYDYQIRLTRISDSHQEIHPGCGGMVYHIKTGDGVSPGIDGDIIADVEI